MVGTERAVKAAAAEGLPICLLISKVDRWVAVFSTFWSAAAAANAILGLPAHELPEYPS